MTGNVATGDEWEDVPGSELLIEWEPDGRYDRETRLANVLAAIQVMGVHEQSRLKVDDWTAVLGKPVRDKGWDEIFAAHPEFFKATVKTIRSKSTGETKEQRWGALKMRQVPPSNKLEIDEIFTLLKLAADLHDRHIAHRQEERDKVAEGRIEAQEERNRAQEERNRAQEERSQRQDKRWWTALAAAVGAISAALISVGSACINANAVQRAADVKNEIPILKEQLATSKKQLAASQQNEAELRRRLQLLQGQQPEGGAPSSTMSPLPTASPSVQ